MFDILFTKHRLQKEEKELGDFIELWKKFDGICQSALAKNTISSEDERLFSDTKDLLARRFELFSKPAKRIFRERDFDKIITEVFNLDKISSLSEEQMNTLNDKRKLATVILNNVLRTYQLKIEDLSKTNSLVTFLKRAFLNPIGFITVVILIFIACYIVGFIIFR